MDPTLQNRPDSMPFIKQKFSRYYQENPVTAPRDVGHREFGFGNDKKIDFRHYSFKQEQDLQNYFVSETPLYGSYSCAYYEFPAGRPMLKKNKQGSELTFEFDVHCTHNTLTCNICMDTTKQDTLSLIEDFLIPDFGFSKNDVSVNFSGNRGYHIHVENDKVQELNSRARREIIDYVMGRDIEFMPQQRPLPAHHGWQGKLSRALHSVIENATPESLREYGFKSTTIEKIIQNKNAILHDINLGIYTNFPRSMNAWQKILQKKIDETRLEIDAGVTLDVSRLMRIPSSLHGGTAFCASIIKNLDAYEPLRDSVVFPDKPRRIQAIKDIPDFQLKDQTINSISNGHEAEVPEFAAMYLICQNLAIPKE
ncbi:MAG: DNA primase catalytic subunit PriS [DPANN group archaeon]|nr:DNA primase catalytic subunit PriS [DPANN group archaeon]